MYWIYTSVDAKMIVEGSLLIDQSIYRDGLVPMAVILGREYMKIQLIDRAQ